MRTGERKMKNQQPLDVARGSVDAFNARDWKRLRELLAPNAVYDEVGTARRLTGPAEIVETMREWTEAFPDVKGTISGSVVSENRVLLEVAYAGTHNGNLASPTGPIAPTGRRINTRCAELCRISDGHIVEIRNYFDMLSMLQALEAIPAPAARRAGA
jgi:steroid delta-isomerase-like uncharacterized protein